MYVELHAASAFSFLRAASLPEALVARAAMLGYPSLALLDRDGVYGAPRFHKAARAAGLTPIVGAELTMDARPGGAAPGQARLRSRHAPAEVPGGSRHWTLPVLVLSQEGYRNLCRLITTMKLRAPKGEGALTLEDLDGHVGGLFALAGRPMLRTDRFGVGGLLDRLVGIFGRGQVAVELQRHLRREEEHDNATLACLAEAFRVPLVATGGVRYAAPSDRALHDVLTCIRSHTTLTAAGRRLTANAERYLKSPAQMARLFADHPAALRATHEIAERAAFTMRDLGYRFPRYPVPDGESELSFLRHITEAGARDRYRPYHDRARAQVARELELIGKLDLAGYFLIVWDIVNFCRQHDILVQGRGSAANSAVCYSLGITAVDPVGMELLFERFLSEERGEWPDIDLDLPSGERRERVIRHVYEKYGTHGAAMTANVITYRGRSAAREVGKVLDLAPNDIDRLARAMHGFEYRDDDSLDRMLAATGLDVQAAPVRQFASLWTALQDLPRHLGQHSGGMVICQGALSSVVPLEPAAMPGRVVVQWDKDDCADMGLIKVDLLGLGMMAALQDAIRLINTAPDPSAHVDLAHLPPDDPEVYRMLQTADTVGLFQVESRAQMATLPRLRPRTFYDLVVQVAIIRPGPIVGQMVHPYLERRAGRAPVEYLHPLLEPALRRTLGVPLFQEQLLRMAMVVAGFTGGQAEELRRAMGARRSEARMRRIEAQLREGMARRGITGDAADRIVQSIVSFALYGFPESHAASFALLAYASAYLKAHYPAAFYTALLNNQPMGFYHPATLVKDGQRRGVRFAPVDVQVSDWDCTIEPDGTVRLGLRYVHGLREATARAIAARPWLQASPGEVTARCPKCGCDDPSLIDEVGSGQPIALGVTSGHAATRGLLCNVCAHAWQAPVPPSRRFRSMEDLMRTVDLRRDELAVLGEVGALNTFGRDRRSALWQVERVVRPSGALYDEMAERMHAREDGAPDDTPDDAPDRGGSPLPPMSAGERLVADYAGTGLSLGPHPMQFRRHDLAMRGVLRACDLPQARPGRRVRTAGMVITRQRPGTAKGMVFLTLEDETGISSIVIRPDVYARERMTVVEAPFLLVDGILQQQDGVTAVRAERVQRLDGLLAAIESPTTP